MFPMSYEHDVTHRVTTTTPDLALASTRQTVLVPVPIEGTATPRACRSASCAATACRASYSPRSPPPPTARPSRASGCAYVRLAGLTRWPLPAFQASTGQCQAPNRWPGVCGSLGASEASRVCHPREPRSLPWELGSAHHHYHQYHASAEPCSHLAGKLEKAASRTAAKEKRDREGRSRKGRRPEPKHKQPVIRISQGEVVAEAENPKPKPKPKPKPWPKPRP